MAEAGGLGAGAAGAGAGAGAAAGGAGESDVREAFDLFDADGSGSIDVEEMGEAMKALGVTVTKPQIEKMMSSVDSDNSGMVSFEEFKQFKLLAEEGGALGGAENEVEESSPDAALGEGAS